MTYTFQFGILWDYGPYLAWGLWHGPLFVMAGTSQHESAVPFAGFVVGMILQSVLYTWLHNNTGGSLWTAIFFHWLSTYAMQVVSSGASRSAPFNWLENAPLLIVAAGVVLLWGPYRLTGKASSLMAPSHERPSQCNPSSRAT